MFSRRSNAIATLSSFVKTKGARPKQNKGIETRISCPPKQNKGIETRISCPPKQNKGIETRISCPPKQNGGTFCDFCLWELKSMHLSDLFCT